MTTRKSSRISKMKHVPKYYCEMDSDDEEIADINDDTSNYSSAYEMSETDPDSDSDYEDEDQDEDEEIAFDHIDSLVLLSDKCKDEETKDERDIVRSPTPIPARQPVCATSRFDFVSELVVRDLWFASKDTLLHRIIDGRQKVNDEIITLLAIFAIAQFANHGSVEHLYNTIGKHPLIVVDNIHVAFKYKYDPSTIVDSLHLRWLYNCFLSKTKINEHIMRKNAYIERMLSLNLENNIRRLFVKDDDRKLQNFVNICDKLYNNDYHTI
jgi:hypothetical protein